MDNPSPPTQPSTPRRRGGQPGNRNAIKHGFYAHQQASPIESLVDLEEEIQVLRLFIRDFLDQDRSQVTFEQNLALLRAVCFAFTALNRLVKTQHWIASNHDEYTDTIKQAIADFAKEANLGV